MTRKPTRPALLALALLAILAMVAAPAQARAQTDQPARVFIITGQSNAGPQGLGTASVPGAWYYSPQATKQTTWQPMRSVNGRYGVEIAIAQTIQAACPDRPVLVVKVYRGGTSIIAWDRAAPGRPGWQYDMAKMANSGTPPQYGRVMDTYKAAMAKWPGPAQVAGVFWVQNERDARIVYGAARYEANLRALIQAWRQDLQAPALPVVVMGAHTNMANGGATVQAAISSVVPTTDQVAVAQADDLPTKSDNIHFNNVGLALLGQRMAEAWLSMAGCQE